MRDAWSIEGDAHAVLLAIEYDQVDEAHLAMLVAHADIIRRIFQSGTAPRVQADTLIRVVRDIKARPEIRVLSGEAAAIRAALQVTIEASRGVSNMAIYRAATASMQSMDRNGGGVRVTL
jgi:hypothetical protein